MDREVLLCQYRTVRQASEKMCQSLQPEEYRIQPFEDASPPWWNLGHTTWFFVRNILQPYGGRSYPEDEAFDFIFNSYYTALGNRLQRPRRGLMTRPTTKDVYRFRQLVDRRVPKLIYTIPPEKWSQFADMLTLGLHHEQQHQELFYTEIKAIYAQSPVHLRQSYRDNTAPPVTVSTRTQVGAVPFTGGLVATGHQASGFAYDNELPVHKHYLYDFALSHLPVTNQEYLEFIEDGGYTQELFWLYNGWHEVQANCWQAPLYWERIDGEWQQWTLTGMRRINPTEPVCHVSFYEAKAFTRWKAKTYQEWQGARLPTEFEWEQAARSLGLDASTGNFLDIRRFHPTPATDDAKLAQMLGDVWEWTQSHYDPYPRYQTFAGALAEYNGKFMDNQRVLRGGSCVTERDHIRISYRNFWAPETRFQFSGFRLAQDLDNQEAQHGRELQ